MIKAHLHAAVDTDMSKHVNTLLSLDMVHVQFHCQELLA